MNQRFAIKCHLFQSRTGCSSWSSSAWRECQGGKRSDRGPPQRTHDHIREDAFCNAMFVPLSELGEAASTTEIVALTCHSLPSRREEGEISAVVVISPDGY
jgi:hypothetical protein